MRRARITYPGAFHHVMSRGLRGECIFPDDDSKSFFLVILSEKAKAFKIRILAYCLMDNHFHLLLENTSGRMSDFLKTVNGQYGNYYRKKSGSRGYVFECRFKSTLISGDTYLKKSILYLLLNPVRANLVQDSWDYRWSSIYEYFTGNGSEIVDNRFVEELFENKKELMEGLLQGNDHKVKVERTRFGEILGSDGFLSRAVKLFNRRYIQGTTHQIPQDQRKKKRIHDQYFWSVPEMIKDFEKRREISLDEVRGRGWIWKRLRGELLVLLKEECGLRYSEIIVLPWFSDMKCNSLGSLYKKTKGRLKTDR